MTGVSGNLVVFPRIFFHLGQLGAADHGRPILEGWQDLCLTLLQVGVAEAKCLSVEGHNPEALYKLHIRYLKQESVQGSSISLYNAL